MRKNNDYLADMLSVSLTSEYNRFGFLPEADFILRQNGGNYDVLRGLRNDPHVWSCLQSRKSGSQIKESSLVFSENTPEKIKLACQVLIEEIDTESLFSDILDAVFFGFQPIEIIWRKSKITWNDKTGKKDSSLLLPERFNALPQEYFLIDNNADIYFRKGFADGENQKISDLKLLNVRHEYNFSNPYGTSLLGKCYWSVKFKNGGIKLWVTFMEKYGMPMVLGKTRRGASQNESQKLLNELSAMCEDAVLVVPSDVELSLFEASRSSSSDLYNDMVKFCNNEISKVILSQTLTTEIQGGSYAASKTHNEIRKDVIQKDLKLIEKTMNKIIDNFLRINFSKEYPKLKTQKLLPKFSFQE